MHVFCLIGLDRLVNRAKIVLCSWLPKFCAMYRSIAAHHIQADSNVTNVSTLQSEPVTGRYHVPGTDLEVIVSLENDALTMVLTKANKRVYRVVVEQATMPIENAWLADMFMRDDRVRLGELSAELADYVESLNISQG